MISDKDKLEALIGRGIEGKWNATLEGKMLKKIQSDTIKFNDPDA